MNTTQRPNTETTLFVVAFLLALFLRLLRLGDLPLSDREAALALQAWQAAQGMHPLLGTQPGYVTLTAGLFYVFGGNDYLARLIPALTGSLLVLVPWLLRDRLPGRSALYLAFIFAFEPGLLALSRSAGGTMMAVTFSLLAAAFWLRRRPRWAGACAGLALLSGPVLIPGLIGLGLAILMNGGKVWNEQSADGGESPTSSQPSRADWAGALLVGAGVFFFVGSALFLLPRGLGAAFNAIPAYIQGWTSDSQVPFWRVLVAFIAYQAFGVIFALVGLVAGWRRGTRLSNWLGFWLLSSLALVLVYPSRQVTDLAWALIPLWALAAIGLDRTVDFSRENLWETIGLMVLTITLLGFAYLNFTALAIPTSVPQDAGLRWIFVGGTIVMLGIVVALVALGWSAEIARRGAMWGLVTALAVYTLSAAMGAAGLRVDATSELWRDSPIISDVDPLVKSLAELSDTTRGVIESLPVTVYGINSPALLWTLRDWNVQQAGAAPVGSDTPLIVGPDEAKPPFGAAYRGEGLDWRLYPTWDTTRLQDWVRWLASRDMPAGNEKIILWARTDLFPDSQNAAPLNPP